MDNILNLRGLTRSTPNSNGQITTFLNHYSYLLARQTPDLFREFDTIHCDGIVLCLFLRLAGIRKIRMSFDMTSIAPQVFSSATNDNLSIYLIGGELGIAERACQILTQDYPNLRIAGIRHGFFSSPHARAQALEEIAQKKPGIVIASMGTPFQEQFLVDLKNTGWRGDGYTSGGFFHQTAKAGLKYYPAWINRFNLRWAFRIKDEPKLLKRYTIDFVRFLFLFLYDAFLYKIRK